VRSERAPYSVRVHHRWAARSSIAAYAKSLGLEVTRFFVEAQSGIRAFYAVAERIDPSTSEGDSALSFRILFAREEHKRIKSRMVGTRRILRDQGYYVEGSPPFGYRRQAKKGERSATKTVLAIQPAEAELVRRINRTYVPLDIFGARCILDTSRRRRGSRLPNHHHHGVTK
jgi:DNA invertase Pin-like site-specific DNA recombinase